MMTELSLPLVNQLFNYYDMMKMAYNLALIKKMSCIVFGTTKIQD